MKIPSVIESRTARNRQSLFQRTVSGLRFSSSSGTLLMAQDPSPQTAERDIESPQSPRAPTTGENRCHSPGQIPHEGRRLLDLCHRKLLAMLTTSNLFAPELRYERLHLPTPPAVYCDRVPLILPRRLSTRRLEILSALSKLRRDAPSLPSWPLPPAYGLPDREIPANRPSMSGLRRGALL